MPIRPLMSDLRDFLRVPTGWGTFPSPLVPKPVCFTPIISQLPQSNTNFWAPNLYGNSLGIRISNKTSGSPQIDPLELAAMVWWGMILPQACCFLPINGAQLR